MANEIQELLRQVKDEKLKSRLTVAIDELRKNKKFGLVFEEHIPELLPLYSAQIRPHVRVARKDGRLTETFLVDRVVKGVATVLPEATPGQAKNIPISELVVVKRFGEAIFPALRHVVSVDRGENAPHHTLIEADNYHALQLLEWLYAGKVDCVYIDPPYNTGAKDWKYNNDFVDKSDSWRHSKWLSMMKRRLLIARRLLCPDGVLIVTIDEHEVHHLATLLEELFPNYLRHIVTMVINPKGTGKHNFARVDEYAIFCVPNLGRSVIAGMPQPTVATAASEEEEEEDEVTDEDAEEADEEGIDEVEDENGLPFPPEEIDQWELRHARRRGGESSYRHQRPNQFYSLLIDSKKRRVVRACDSLPVDKKPSFKTVDGLVPVWPIDKEGNERCWRFIPSKMQTLIDAGRVVLGRYNKQLNSWTINYWVKKSTSKKLKTVWWDTAHDAGTHGTTLLHKILGRRNAFPFPKSIYATRDAIAAVVRGRPNALIVDFFAGSGTTLQSVALLNEADGGERRCVLVTNNEVQEREAKRLAKQGSHPGEDAWESHGICRSVTFPRCKFVINGSRDDDTRLAGDYLTGQFVKQEIPRTIRSLDFTTAAFMAGKRAHESLAVALGYPKSKVTGEEPFFLGGGEHVAVLLDPAALPEFLSKGRERADEIETVYLPTLSGKAFKQAKDEIANAWPPLIKTVEVKRPIGDGLAASLDYFRLEFLDRSMVETGGKLTDILPALWMMAGCRGRLPTCKGKEKVLFFDDCPFAVLVDESAIKPFLDKLEKRPGIDWAFLVTNDQDSFAQMCEWLPERIPSGQRVHLWRNYVDNFLINVDHGATRVA